MAYDKPLVETYRYLANASLSTAAVAGRIIGPKGKTGKVLNCSVVTTTATTVAASELRIGTAADPDAVMALAVPVTAINLGVVATEAACRAAAVIAADTIYQISGDGGATVGAGDITVTVGWY